MNILVTDTSAQALTVALKTDSFFETRTSESRSLQHSERLVPTVVELCRDAGISEKDIDLLACTRGPGSFTGLRIGMAAFKGMAYASGKPLVSVSTLEVLAHCVPYFDGAVVTVIDAKKQRWYLAAFDGKTRERIMPVTRSCMEKRGNRMKCSFFVIIPYACALSNAIMKSSDLKHNAGRISPLCGMCVIVAPVPRVIDKRPRVQYTVNINTCGG